MLLARLSSTEWATGDERIAAEVLGVRHDIPAQGLRKGLQALIEQTRSL